MYVQDVQCKKNGEDDLLLGFFSLFHSQLCTVGASSLSALSRVTQCAKITHFCIISIFTPKIMLTSLRIEEVV